jgi:hypothetical protein
MNECYNKKVHFSIKGLNLKSDNVKLKRHTLLLLFEL